MTTQRQSRPEPKEVLLRTSATERHWVGDGFYVSSLVRPEPGFYSHTDPFLLLDYAAPRHFAPSEHQRGVGEHPHRGFETVTFAIQGEIAHRDSGGGGGVISAGGVQWMTAGSGLVHEELFSPAFTRSGGQLEMVQLWVNLPRERKWMQPRYQGYDAAAFPVLPLGDEMRIRLIAGTYNGAKGPCQSQSPMTALFLESDGNGAAELVLPPKTNTICLVLRGSVAVSGEGCSAGDLVVFHAAGEIVPVACKGGCQILVLNAVPLNEPMVSHGPFVMSTREEIIQAIADYQSGKMGRLDKR
jgi:redox-sensitive bicupin YhaK (pirin superfamily)